MDWKESVRAELAKTGKRVVLGIGNADRADDAAGPDVVRRLEARFRGNPCPGLLIIDGGAVPENVTGTIRRFAPDIVLVVDAAVGRFPPGTIFLPDPEGVSDETVSTHKISLRHLIRYLQEDIGSRALVIGIQPATLTEGEPVSSSVRRAVRELAGGLAQLLRETKASFPSGPDAPRGG